jgi:alkanesulfonate monooxygenase SsuD/methylene tetrahydromethanopterin reductase-like flavin-dependent oxidoreductase (luciferase family)
VWNRDLSAYDPDGPLPDIDPDLGEPSVVQGRASMFDDKMKTASQWRALAEAKNLSIRELMIEVTGRASFVGTPLQVATQIDQAVVARAADGFILVPHVTPGGLDEFADTVVPILQEWGRFRSDYEGPTLRDHLGLPPSRRTGANREEQSA